MKFEYTLVRATVYSDLEHLAAAADGVELPEEEEHILEVEYSIYGKYRPATWGYYGGEPAEYPELELGEIHGVDEDGNEYEIVLTPQEEQEIEAAAWEHADNYDPY